MGGIEIRIEGDEGAVTGWPWNRMGTKKSTDGCTGPKIFSSCNFLLRRPRAHQMPSNISFPLTAVVKLLTFRKIGSPGTKTKTS
jgi:hypothetical protein